MPLDTPNSEEQARISSVDSMIERALRAIDAAFERRGQGVEPTITSGSYAKKMAQREEARAKAPGCFDMQGWVQHGLGTGEYSHPSAPHIRVKRFNKTKHLAGKSYGSLHWAWRPVSERGWRGEFKTRSEALAAATREGGDDV